MFCMTCGNQINDDAMFCPKCGAKVELSESTMAEIMGITDMKDSSDISLPNSKQLTVKPIITILFILLSVYFAVEATYLIYRSRSYLDMLSIIRKIELLTLILAFLDNLLIAAAIVMEKKRVLLLGLIIEGATGLLTAVYFIFSGLYYDQYDFVKFSARWVFCFLLSVLFIIRITKKVVPLIVLYIINVLYFVSSYLLFGVWDSPSYTLNQRLYDWRSWIITAACIIGCTAYFMLARLIHKNALKLN